MLMVIGLAWVYQRYGTTPEAGWLLYGIKPVVIGLILNALWALGRRAVKGRLTAVVGAVVLVLYFLGYNEIALLFAGGACGHAGRPTCDRLAEDPAWGGLSCRHGPGNAPAGGLGLWLQPAHSSS